jgi:hypothetical protein
LEQGKELERPQEKHGTDSLTVEKILLIGQWQRCWNIWKITYKQHKEKQRALQERRHRQRAPPWLGRK